MSSRGPLVIAIVLLLLPVLYVGSYLALVIPGGIHVLPNGTVIRSGEVSEADHYRMTFKTYRFGGNWSEFVFWPIEQADRSLRPTQWQAGFIYWRS
jgi:hypothetical protein